MAVSARPSWAPQSHRSEPSTSPVKHSEWSLTSGASHRPTSPWTKAIGSVPLRESEKTVASNVPMRVGRRALLRRRTRPFVAGSLSMGIRDGDQN